MEDIHLRIENRTNFHQIPVNHQKITNDLVQNKIFSRNKKFPKKLWRIVNECENGAVQWSSSGKSILLDYVKFSNTYLKNKNKKLFKTSNISSFVRQLNLYDFHKIISDHRDALCNVQNPNIHEFANDWFQKERPDLLIHVTRTNANLVVHSLKERKKAKYLNQLKENISSVSSSPSSETDDKNIVNPSKSCKSPRRKLLQTRVSTQKTMNELTQSKRLIINKRFPRKLWRLVNECNNGAVQWSPSGNSILLDYEIFPAIYLKNQNNKLFKTSNISSFVRQLNLYGFHKVTSDHRDALCNVQNPNIHEFANEWFRRERPDLLVYVTRTNANVRIHSCKERKRRKSQLKENISSDSSPQLKKTNDKKGFKSSKNSKSPRQRLLRAREDLKRGLEKALVFPEVDICEQMYKDAHSFLADYSSGIIFLRKDDKNCVSVKHELSSYDHTFADDKNCISVKDKLSSYDHTFADDKNCVSVKDELSSYDHNEDCQLLQGVKWWEESYSSPHDSMDPSDVNWSLELPPLGSEIFDTYDEIKEEEEEPWQNIFDCLSESIVNTPPIESFDIPVSYDYY